MSSIRTAQTDSGATVVVVVDLRRGEQGAIVHTADEAAVAASAEAFLATQRLAAFHGQPVPSRLLAWLRDDGFDADDGHQPPRRRRSTVPGRRRARPAATREPAAPPGPATLRRLARALTDVGIGGVEVTAHGESISITATGWRHIDQLLRGAEALVDLRPSSGCRSLTPGGNRRFNRVDLDAEVRR